MAEEEERVLCPKCGQLIALAMLSRHDMRCTRPMASLRPPSKERPPSQQSSSSTAPATASSPPDESIRYWVCPACTFRNLSMADCCQMCGGAKPPSTQLPVSAGVAAAAAAMARASVAGGSSSSSSNDNNHNNTNSSSSRSSSNNNGRGSGSNPGGDGTVAHVPVLPPLVFDADAEGMMLGPPWNRRIPSDKAVLALLHANAPWIPGEHQIRPSPETLELKAVQMDTAERFYTTMSDYVYDLIFNFPTKMEPDGKLSAAAPPPGRGGGGGGSGGVAGWEKKKVFAPNEFPYALSEGSHHHIMWYSYAPPHDLTEHDVNADITAALSGVVRGGFEFVWYENPKMTIPGIYHVQVFWHEVEVAAAAAAAAAGGSPSKDTAGGMTRRAEESAAAGTGTS